MVMVPRMGGLVFEPALPNCWGVPELWIGAVVPAGACAGPVGDKVGPPEDMKLNWTS